MWNRQSSPRPWLGDHVIYRIHFANEVAASWLKYWQSSRPPRGPGVVFVMLDELDCANHFHHFLLTSGHEVIQDRILGSKSKRFRSKVNIFLIRPMIGNRICNHVCHCRSCSDNLDSSYRLAYPRSFAHRFNRLARVMRDGRPRGIFTARCSRIVSLATISVGATFSAESALEVTFASCPGCFGSFVFPLHWEP
jgi:hypothetical protein